MSLERRALDEELRKRECLEEVRPHALRGPADIPVVEGFARAIDARRNPTAIPRRQSGPRPPPSLAVDLAISSGSLITLTATAEVGPFDEGFFDAIDIEWCSRAWPPEPMSRR